MNLNLSGHHLDITPAIREYVTKKLEKIKRHFDNVIDVAHAYASGTYDNSTWKSLMYLGVSSLQVSFTNGDPCPFNLGASRMSIDVVITCNSTLSAPTITASQRSAS